MPAVLDAGAPGGISPAWALIAGGLDRGRLGAARLAGVDAESAYAAWSAGQAIVQRREQRELTRQQLLTGLAASNQGNQGNQGNQDTSPDLPAVLPQAREWNWTAQGSERWRAEFVIRDYPFQAVFSGDEGDWSLDWKPLVEVPQGTGMFPEVNRILRGIVTDFIDTANPSALYIAGSDSRRNAYYAAHYAEWAPDGYTFKVHHDTDSRESSSEGVSMVSFERNEPRATPGNT